MRADYLETQSNLRLAEQEHREAVEASVFFMNVPPGRSLSPTLAVDRMEALVFLPSRTFNPGSRAVASFDSNEGAQLLRNQRLADRLLARSSLVQKQQEEEANLQKGVAGWRPPFAASLVNVGLDVAAFGEVAGTVPGHLSNPDPREPVIVDQEFVNYVPDRYKWQRLALRDIKPVRAAVTEILRLIDDEFCR